MSRKLFTAGCVALIVTGLVHLLGHYKLTTTAGDTEHERQLFAMMRADPQDMGFGMLRTMFDFLTGFSLTFSALPLGMGIAGFVVRRHAASAPVCCARSRSSTRARGRSWSASGCATSSRFRSPSSPPSSCCSPRPRRRRRAPDSERRARAARIIRRFASEETHDHAGAARARTKTTRRPRRSAVRATWPSSTRRRGCCSAPARARCTRA